MELDPNTFGLIGTAIGALVGIVGHLISAQSTLRRERASFFQQSDRQHQRRLRSLYQDVLSLMFEAMHGAAVDRARFGALAARVSLLGSPEVLAHMNALFDPHARDRHGEYQALVDAMKAHLSVRSGIDAR